MKKFSIGYRTLKTAFGAAIAIAIAQYFELASYASAGILTILCVQPTKKKSLHAAYTRFVASIIGMLYAFLSFELFFLSSAYICRYADRFHTNNCIIEGCRWFCL